MLRLFEWLQALASVATCDRVLNGLLVLVCLAQQLGLCDPATVGEVTAAVFLVLTLRPRG